MKKSFKSLLCVLFAAIMLLSISSCGKTTETPENGENGSGETTETPENSKKGKIVMEDNGGNKVILILVDGMRPDAMEQCGNSYIDELKKNCAYTMNAKTIYPSKTLPAHLSLFYSIPPEKHGTEKNEFTPREIKDLDDHGLFERLHGSGKKTCMYYSWEPLRDVAAPESLTASEMLRYQDFEAFDEDILITERALKGIEEIKPDFAFIYIGSTDSTGHNYGWMTGQYLERVSAALDRIKEIIDATGERYSIIITADHGGSSKNHGNNTPEDMTIPMFFYGKDIKAGEISGEVSIMDITPTVADIIDVKKPKSWEGKSLWADIKK